MLIKKDGSVYVIKGPNKLVKDQKEWNNSDLKFYNFNWQEISYLKLRNNKDKINFPEIKPKIDTSLPASNKELPIPEIKDVDFSKNYEEETVKEETKFPKIKYKVLMHCLPSNTINYKDDFYGESWSKINYGKKFIFPSIIVEMNDLNLLFWTSDPNQQIKEKSIIFPFAYENYNEIDDSYYRTPFDEHRWWKIIKKENKTNGWLFHSIPSQEHPDFSD